MYIKTSNITDSLYEAIKCNKLLIDAIDWEKVGTETILSLYLVTGEDALKEVIAERICPDKVPTTQLQQALAESFSWQNKYKKAQEDLDATISWYHRELEKKQEVIDQQHKEIINQKCQINQLSKIEQTHNRHNITKEWTIGKDSYDMSYEDLLYSTANKKAYVRCVNLKLYDDDGENVIHILQ